MPGGAPLTIECEIAFTLAHDLPAAAPRPPLRELIASTCVTFEIVRSRFVNRRSVGWPSFVADNVGFEALVVGDTFPLDQLPEVLRTVEVWADGTARVRAQHGDDLTDPFASLQSLLDHAAERGMDLRAGELVSTGAMCTPFDLPGTGHAVSARFYGRQLDFTV